MSKPLSERQQDFLLEVNPCLPFPAQKIKLWYDDFSGEFYPVQHHTYGKHMKNSFSLHYITEGEGKFAAEDEPLRRLGKGDLFFICDRQLIRYFPDEKKPWKYCGISFGAPEMTDFFNSIGWTSSRILFHDSLTDRIGTLIKETIEKKENGSVGQYDLLGCACQILSLLENHCANALPLPSATQLYVSRVKEYLETSYSDPDLRISRVADSVNLSHPYLCRIFKRMEGCSPEQYLLRHRLSVAKRLLSETTYSVGEVAFLCGYTDASQFSRMYKKHFGISPTKER
ncbi:MAG: AraC family transcriptional regulator [Clostridia bacterium]|nr:AraC family transcriptional regulator [Clostridia bacterium]